MTTRTDRSESMDYSKIPPPMMSPVKAGQSDHIPVYKMVLTGGPCAGKTTALARLSTFFRDRGFRVYLVPEAATIVQMGGASFFDLEHRDHVINFQWQILKTQMMLEDTFSSLAQDSGKPCIILCDRGSMDGSAYIDKDLWEDLKLKHDLDTVTLRDTRYIAVFHLVTAALGAESFYSLENNQTRTEDLETARIVDRKTCKAWVGHPRLYVIDNSTDFEGKMQRLVHTASRLCGIPSTTKSTRKFRLAAAPKMEDIPVHHEDFEVEKVYMQRETSETSADYSFVRCRSQFGLPAYGMTTVRHLQDGEQVDLKRVITAREYSYAVRHRADSKRHNVKQQRICFLWQDQSFQIHIYKEPEAISGLAICHVQASSQDTENLQIPPFLEIAQELHDGDKNYSAYKISLVD